MLTATKKLVATSSDIHALYQGTKCIARRSPFQEHIVRDADIASAFLAILASLDQSKNTVANFELSNRQSAKMSLEQMNDGRSKVDFTLIAEYAEQPLE